MSILFGARVVSTFVRQLSVTLVCVTGGLTGMLSATAQENSPVLQEEVVLDPSTLNELSNAPNYRYTLGDISRNTPGYYDAADKISEADLGFKARSTVDFSCMETYGRYEVTLFKPRCGEDGAKVWSQTKLMFGLGVGVAGVIWLLPEEVSGWDKDDPTPLRQSWRDNVREGPVWDKDEWYLNYIGHPYFGGVYYQVARKSGFNEWNSFVYGALMSTFYWEYGLEAFAEVPSIQDLIVTPFGGAIYGEWAYQKERKIRAGGGKVWNSYFWGSTALFLLDPVDSIAVWINRAAGRQWIKTGTVVITQTPPVRNLSLTNDDYWGLRLTLNF